MRFPILRSAGALTLLAALSGIGCGHSDGFTAPTSTQLVPFSGGSDTRLTYNADQDYWPTWTEDSAGVLYAFVPGDRPDHDRCVGLLSAQGGTRLWEMCDNQAGHADSTDSFTAFALGRDGRLLYQEVSAPLRAEVPTTKALWLADSAHPFNRRRLILFPIQINGQSVDWLGDLQWTGPQEFIALATEYTPVPRGFTLSAQDSAWVGRVVVTGHIDAAGATLSPIPGTEGANSYALAEAGQSVVFSRRSGTEVLGVSIHGGTATQLGTVGDQSTIAGIACRLLTCVVATNQIVLLPNGPHVFPDLLNPAGHLYRFDISTGLATLRRTGDTVGNTGMYAAPLIAPNGTDLILQIGGTAGHLESAGTPFGDLHLFKGILP